jgi:endonuclease-3
MKLNEKYNKILDWFSENMPVAESELNYTNPFELLVAVVLSAQCTDKRVNMVTPALFKAYPTAEEMSKASLEEILHYISSVSYPNNKAKHLLGLSKVLVEKYSGVVPASQDELQTLPGVGRKTANVVMAVAFDKPAMPVDTHVFRVSHRLGLVPKTATTPLAVEKKLVKNIPHEILGLAHHWLLLHGRYVCKALKPDCENCGLHLYCSFKSKKIGK